MYLSVVIPVFNEEKNLDRLIDRLKTTLLGIGKDFEVIFVDDGSSDSSLSILKEKKKDFEELKILSFNRNYGQHAAVFAGLAQSKGEIVVTLDADLQNPPEEIPKLVAKIEEGFDSVGGMRVKRKDNLFRKIASYGMNKITSKIVGIELKDYGCMLRAYKRDVIDSVLMCQETTTYIPALANSFAKKITEIPVSHSERGAGESKYSIIKLLQLNFDLMTGFSLVPIQLVSFSGIFISLLGILFGIFLLVRRFVIGPESEGVFTLFAILFVFVGISIFALGLIGEYVGRIYLEVKKRPRFIIKETID